MINDSIINFFESRKEDYKILVKLTYFKSNGKYYSEGEYMEDYILLYEIWENVEKMEKHPGLSGRWKGMILIDVPEHVHNHPHVLLAK